MLRSWLYGFFLFFIYLASLYGEGEIQTGKKKTICLNMIVKNETHIVKRCLDSVSSLIDYWVIVDTGSTDGTQEYIKKLMAEKGIPGELLERPWVNFGHNRTEALKLAKGKGDYLLFIDADEYLIFEPDFALPVLEKDFYYTPTRSGGTNYVRVGLINNHKEWSWVGVVHEVVIPQFAASGGTLEKVVMISNPGGDRSRDEKKYLKDAELLEKDLKEHPQDARSRFYLAQSYRDAGNLKAAIENYQKRAAMGGWDEEVFCSLWQIGQLQERLKEPEEEIIKSYVKAFQYRPSRIEPLYQLMVHFMEKNDFEKGYAIGKIGMSTPPSKDILFVQGWMSDYGLPLEYSVCAYWTGRYQECVEVSEKLLKRKDLPDHIREVVERNLKFAREKAVVQDLEGLLGSHCLAPSNQD